MLPGVVRVSQCFLNPFEPWQDPFFAAVDFWFFDFWFFLFTSRECVFFGVSINREQEKRDFW